ncbi:MAG: hypothetical protein IT308_08700 [Anaerolineaceae bacterium]|nr:hypothetical protein [Anaerolineaceae bacterium]
MSDILDKLVEGNLRTTGRSVEVAAEVLASPASFGDLFAGLRSESPGVRMRAADAIEKITRVRPDLLEPYRGEILNDLTRIAQKEVRWHICQIIPRLNLFSDERKTAAAQLETYLEDKSRIVRTFALQALADLALTDLEAGDFALVTHTIAILEKQSVCGIPSVQSRSKKLLAKLREKSQKKM